MGTAFMESQGQIHPLPSFQNTQWSVVLAANQSDSPKAQEALARLCQTYWYPVFLFVRRRGHDTESAKDLTQEFFTRVLDRQYLRVADRERGRFRTFLLACLEGFLNNEYKREKALKRGGQYFILPFPEAGQEDAHWVEPMAGLAPDKLLDRQWALTVLERTFDLLKQEQEASGKLAQYEALQGFLSGAKESERTFAEVGAHLNMSEAAARQAAHRLRGRFGQLLRQCVAETVAGPHDLESEMIHLRAILSDDGTS